MSGVVLPTSTSAVSRWQLVDFLRISRVTEPAAGGEAWLDVGQLASDELWLIDRIVASCDSESRTTLRLYEAAVDPMRYLSGSSAGNFDEADYPAGLQVAPSESLLAVWTGAADGARGTLAIQGRIWRRS